MTEVLTTQKLLDAVKKIKRNDTKKFVEIYPLAWKEIPELKELCDARVKNGLGVWAEMVKL